MSIHEARSKLREDQNSPTEYVKNEAQKLIDLPIAIMK